MKNIDFLPLSYHEARQRRRLRLRRLWLAVVGVCVLAGWLGTDELRVHRARRQLESLLVQNDTVQAGLEQIAQLQAEQAALLDRYRLVEALESPVSCVTTLQRIAELLPQDVVLRQLQLTCGTAANLPGTQVAPAPATPQDHPDTIQLILSGIAPSQVDIAILVGRLSGCRDFANVRLEYSKASTVESRQVHEFRVTVDVVKPAHPVAATTTANLTTAGGRAQG